MRIGGSGMRPIVALVGASAVAASLLVSAQGASGAPIPINESSTKADDWVPEQIQPTKYPLKWSRATLDDKVTLDRLGRRPIVDQDELTWLLACEREVQLDCVESIGLVSKSGEYSPGRWVRGITGDVEGRPNEGIGPYSQHQTIWEVPGLVVGGKPAQMIFLGGLAGPGTLGSPGLNMDLNLFDVDMIPSTSTSPRGCRETDNGECLVPPDFPDGTRIRVVLRTSWLAASGVMARGMNVTVGVDDLGGGAHRWTVTGDPMLVQSRGRADELPAWVVSSFYFMMFDPRLTGNTISECAVFRPMIFSGNAQRLDFPRWKPWEGRLDLSMESAHYWADRKTEWRGHYETSIPEATARCLWGIDPRLTSTLSVAVYTEDGEEKAATTSIGVRDGYVQIRAYDFTFSSNTVSAKVKVKAGQRCFTRGVKIIDLVCTKKGKKLVWVKARR